MPELPEVETIRRQLDRTVKGKKIVKVEVLYPKVVRPLTATAFRRGVTGASIRAVRRRAKLILLELSNGNTMVVHLKLTGRLLLKHDPEPPNKSTELVFDLTGPTKLYYDDLRRFGFIKYVPTRELERYLNEKGGYGPEPFDASFTVVAFKKLLAMRPNAKIKPLLMDQTFIAGMGNIYAQEACFCAGILPTRRVGTLTDAAIQKLHSCLRRVMQDAIRHRGSSANDYLDLYGQEGQFVPRLKVYGREGKPCVRCGTRLKKMTLASRGTSWCPKCQT